MKLRRTLALILTALMMLGMIPSATAMMDPAGNVVDHTHHYDYDSDEYVEIWYEPTCTEPGRYEYFCTECWGGSQIVDVPALGHDWSEWENVTKEPTCTEEGFGFHYCHRCGLQERGPIPALGHDWGSWYVVEEAQRCKYGIQEHKCQRCGITQQRRYYMEGTLKRGDKGDAVKQFQQALNEAGYDCGTPDGDFGPKTEAAVKAYQKDHGMEQDGIGYLCIQDDLKGAGISFTLEAEDTTGWVTYQGQETDVEMTVTNTGKQPLHFTGITYRYPDDTYADDDHQDFWDNPKCLYLEPGDSTTFTYTVKATDKDAFYGHVERNVALAANLAKKDESGEDINTYDETTFSIDFGEQRDLAFTVEAEDTTGWTASLDDVVPVNVTVTNTGLKPLFFTQITYQYVDKLGPGAYQDSVNLWAHPEATYLEPGKSFDFTYSVKVTSVDVDNGFIARYFTLAASEGVLDSDGNGNMVEGSAWVYGSDDFSMELGEADGTSLYLAGETVNAQIFYGAGMTYDTNLTPSNIGKEALHGCEVALFAWDTGAADFVYQGTVLTWGEDTVAGPGEDFSKQMYQLPIEKWLIDMATGNIVNIAYQARAFTDSGDPVYSNMVFFEFNVDADMSVKLVLEAGDTTGMSGEFGEWLWVPLTVTNKGTETMKINAIYTRDGLGDNTYLKYGEYRDYYDFAQSQWLVPEDSTKVGYWIYVGADDLSAGEIRRYAEANAHRWVTDDPTSDLTGDNAVLDMTLYNSNEVEIVIPLREKPDGEPKLALAVEQASPEKTYYDVGDEITFNYTVTNIGDMPCLYGGVYRYRDPGHMAGSDEEFSSPDKSFVLMPHAKNSYTDSGKITLTKELLMSDGFWYSIFEALGIDIYTGEYDYPSNQVPFKHPAAPDGYDDWDPEPNYTDITVKKSCLSTPMYDEKGFVENESILYYITVTNETGETIEDVEVYDPMKGENEDGVVAIIPELGPYETVDCYFVYTVTKNDVETLPFLKNTATATWWDVYTEQYAHSKSNTVIVPLAKGTPVPGEITLTKYVVSPYPHYDENGDGYYLEGEWVDFLLVLSNNTDETFYDVYVFDPITTDSYHIVAYYEKLEPGQVEYIPVPYEVTSFDAWLGSITNFGYADCYDERGNYKQFCSNDVTVYTRDETPQPDFGLSITKSAKAPLNGSYFEENETIYYSVTVVNTGEETLTDVIVTDYMNGAFTGPVIGTLEHLYPSQAQTFYFTHVVNHDDVVRGEVYNYATADYTFDYGYFAVSNTVRCKTREGEPDPDPTPRNAEGDPCKRTLTGLGNGETEYALHNCDTHLEVAKQVDELVSKATTTDERVKAWNEARALWQEAADKQYEEMFTTVAPTAERQIIVLNERAMFYAQAAVREAELKLLYPDDPETVARELAELMMNHVVDLCYAIHTAPEARVDSYLGSHGTLNCAPAAVCGIEILDGTVGDVRYSEQLCDAHNSTRDIVLKLIDGAKTEEEQLSAWKQAQKLWQIELNAATNKVYKAASREDRAVITSDRKTFDNWLHTYEDLLNMLYPEGYAAAETISKALMDRTLDFCGLAE